MVLQRGIIIIIIVLNPLYSSKLCKIILIYILLTGCCVAVHLCYRCDHIFFFVIIIIILIIIIFIIIIIVVVVIIIIIIIIITLIILLVIIIRIIKIIIVIIERKYLSL